MLEIRAYKYCLFIQFMDKSNMKLNDALAIDLTVLANERTFLAYFRTFIVFLSSGFAIIKLNALEEISDIGYFLIGIAPVIFLIGIGRFFYVRKQMKKYVK